MCHLFPAETCCWSIKKNKEMKGMMERFFLGTLRMCHLFPAETSCWSIRENKEMKGMMEKSLGNMLR